jgi:hypothetical protein
MGFKRAPKRHRAGHYVMSSYRPCMANNPAGTNLGAASACLPRQAKAVSQAMAASTVEDRLEI